MIAALPVNDQVQRVANDIDDSGSPRQGRSDLNPPRAGR